MSESVAKNAVTAGKKVGLFILASLSVAPFFRAYQPAAMADEGFVTLPALRIFLGDAPYADFVTLLAPGSYYLLLPFYWLFGPSIESTRLLMMVFTGGLGLTIYLLAHRCLSPKWALLPYGLFLCAGVTQWPILSYHWAAILAFCLGVLALLQWEARPNQISASICGASTAFTGWVLQSEVAALLFLTLLVAILFRKKMTLKFLAIWFAAMLSTSLLLWSPILLWASVSDVWTQNVTWIISHNVQPGGSSYSLDQIVNSWSGFLAQLGKVQVNVAVVGWALHSLSYLLVWTFNYVCFYPLLLLAAWFGFRGRENNSVRILILAQVALVLVWSSRQTMLYLNYLTPIYYVLACWLLQKWGRKGAVGGVLLLCVFGTGYFFQYLDSRSYRYPIQTIRGTLYASSPQDAATLNLTFRSVAKLTPPGREAYVYPCLPNFYYLSGVRPVSHLNTVIPILGPDQEVPKLANFLNDSGLEIIYYKGWSEQALGAVPSVDPILFKEKSDEFDQIILEGYEQVGQAGLLTVFRKKKI